MAGSVDSMKKRASCAAKASSERVGGNPHCPVLLAMHTASASMSGMPLGLCMSSCMAPM